MPEHWITLSVVSEDGVVSLDLDKPAAVRLMATIAVKLDREEEQ